MKKIVILSFLIISFKILAAGLSGGDQYSAVTIEGNLSVQCFGNSPGPNYGTANCRSEILNPGEYSYFIGPVIDADSVTLQASWEIGKMSKTKTEKYDGTKGKSVKSFNLWIQTVFQRPLLDYGKNLVNYTLTKNGNKVESGNFTVEVVKGGNNICTRSGFFTSSNNQDCSFPSNFCSTYFEQNNYCQ